MGPEAALEVLYSIDNVMDDVYKSASSRAVLAGAPDEFPHLTIEINGGITTLDAMTQHLNHVDAVMIGRAAYDNPFLFNEVDSRFYGAPSQNPVSRLDAIKRMLPYIEEARSRGITTHKISRHLLNAFCGQYNGKAWRRFLTENSSRKNAGPELIEEALQLVSI